MRNGKAGSRAATPTTAQVGSWIFKVTVFFCIAILAATGMMDSLTAHATEPAAGTADSESLPPAPEISAQNAIVMELSSGKVLYEKQAYQKAYPASITKIMTALLAVEDGNPERIVRISGNAAGTEGSSIYLAPGESISMRDLLHGLMLRSGNDAAMAIAETLGGSVEGFVERMNRRALFLGARSTHFMNPSGLFHENHYTTCYDMALIARAAMMNAEFRAVVGAKQWTADRGEGKYNHFYNKNKVIFQYEGGTGVKIGYTKASGRTLVASSARNGMELICVVMNAPDWFQDSYALMDYIHTNYEMEKIAEGGKVLKAVPVGGSERDHVYVGPAVDIVFPIRKGEASEVSIRYLLPGRMEAPIRRWQKAGSLAVYNGGIHLFNHPLYYLEDIK